MRQSLNVCMELCCALASHLLWLRHWLPVLDSSSNEGEGSSAGSTTSRGPYTVLTPAQKFEIGKRAAEMGTTVTIRYYAKRYPDICLKETSVRRFKNNYQDGSC